jgi:hypothetical protein
MRFFELLNFQHLMGVLFPTLLFMLLFVIGLGFMHFRTKDAEARKTAITHEYPTGIRERNGPVPLIMVLTILGTFLWAFFYILMHGVLGVKI